MDGEGVKIRLFQRKSNFHHQPSQKYVKKKKKGKKHMI